MISPRGIYQKICKYAMIEDQKRFILIGNKCDLEDQRQISYFEAKDSADEKGMVYIIISKSVLGTEQMGISFFPY